MNVNAAMNSVQKQSAAMVILRREPPDVVPIIVKMKNALTAAKTGNARLCLIKNYKARILKIILKAT